jgi:hypothetical protein
MGFGIGLIVGRICQGRFPHLHEHSMSQNFGPVEVSLIWREGAMQQPHTRAFADTIQSVLKRKK